jgi:acid stress-induced BolA-like protein IbaG/YrbA
MGWLYPVFVKCCERASCDSQNDVYAILPMGHDHHSASNQCEAIEKAIKDTITDAQVRVTGGGGHYTIEVVSTVFAGKGMLDSQRLVYSAIAPLMKGDDAPVHAVDSLRTRTP